MLNNKNKIQIKKSKKLLVEIIYSLFEKFIASYKPKNTNAVEWVVVLKKLNRSYFKNFLTLAKS